MKKGDNYYVSVTEIKNKSVILRNIFGYEVQDIYCTYYISFDGLVR